MMKTDPTSAGTDSKFTNILTNLLIGLTVSFVALSLGAALGILSGRGAFAGMISAGVIATITSVLGGTRVQCSGPTAPMSAVTAVVVAYALENAITSGMAAHQFINLTLILAGGLLILMAVFRLGRFIDIVPNVVVSGFMSGIALLIWVDQVGRLFGLGSRTVIGGSVAANFMIVLATLGLIFGFAPIAQKLVGPRARFLPATLMAIVIVSAISNGMGLTVEYIRLEAGVESLAGLGDLILAQVPTGVTSAALLLALPYAFQLAILCYLDTLLTSLVVDRMSGETTKQNRELMAQGVANGVVAFLGGIPGAQATIRSVLMLKEGASLRIAGIMVGVFVLIEIVLFQDVINLIPKAVFIGVLLKVGYDVFDFKPIQIYARQVAEKRVLRLRGFFSRHDDEPIFVTNRELLMILGTAGVTVGFDLNVAVGFFTVFFYFHNRVWKRHNPMRDLKPDLETDAFTTQN